MGVALVMDPLGEPSVGAGGPCTVKLLLALQVPPAAFLACTAQL